MSRPGRNLPAFRELQLEFTAYVRNPAASAAPAGIEARRMQVYADLVYNNIEKFLAKTFPVSLAILGNGKWHALVRGFVHRHRASSPYFLDIPREFLGYLGAQRTAEPPFLLELMHYEWVELALDVADEDLDAVAVDPAGDLLAGAPVVSPLAWCSSYAFPVHQIGVAYRPTAPPPERTFLIVYRDRRDRVRFMASNAVTARLLALLRDEGLRGRVALERIAREIGGEATNVAKHGADTLERLRNCDIILGTRKGSG